jgi:uncharacterized protein YndB with AHSA1/START domain
MNEPTTTAVEPVVREVVVAAPADTCYRTFVDGFATWWPPEHHIGEDRTITALVLEPFAGGRCYDVDTDGGECQWGTVLVTEPPDRFVLAWHIQGDWTIDLDPQLQSEVEITFVAVDDTTTRVRLEHRNLERHGSGAAGLRDGISGEGGWTLLVRRFADVVEGRPVRPVVGPGA